MKRYFYLLCLLAAALQIRAQESSDPYSNWQQDGPQTPNFNGQPFRGWVDAICVNANNPDEMLLATRTSGIFRTANRGVNWTCVTDTISSPVLGCRAMISLPSDPSRVIAITGFDEIDGTVIYSRDFGVTWQSVAQNLPTFRWIDHHPTLPNVVFGCSNNSVFYSLDKGETWINFGAPYDIDFHPNEMFKIFVKENSVCVISKARWDAVAYLHECKLRMKKNKKKFRYAIWSKDKTVEFLSNPDEKMIFIDYSNRAGKTHYLQINSTGGKKTLQTNDGGLTYTPISISNFPVGSWWKNEIIASLNDSNLIYYGQTGMMRKYDKRTGLPTTILNDPENPGHHDDYRSSHLISVGGADFMALGHDGGVGVVKNGLAQKPTITNANGDLSINLLHTFDLHEGTGRVVFAYQDGPMFYRDKDGSFSKHFLWEGSAAMIHKQYPDAIVGENAYAGIADKDEKTFPIVKGTLGSGGCFLGGPFVTYHHFPNRFARGLRNGKVALNRDANVSEISTIPNTTSEVGAIAFCARKPKFLYASTSRPDDGIYKLHRSRNDGKTWENLTVSKVTMHGQVFDLNTKLHWTNIKSIAVDPDDENTVFCGIGNTNRYMGTPVPNEFRVLKSTDGGLHFTDYSEGLPAVPVSELLAVESDNGLLFCATVYGVFYRTREMNSWAPFNHKLPKVEITALKYDYCNQMLYASTYGRGLWKTKVGFEVPNTYSDEISSHTTWEDDRILCDHLTIKSGATLTIKGKVEKYRNKTIVVESGANLIFDGGVITEYCREE